MCLIAVALCVSALFSGAVFGLSHRSDAARSVAGLGGLTIVPVLLWCIGETISLNGHSHALLSPLGALVFLWMLFGNLVPLAFLIGRLREMRFSPDMLIVGATHTVAWGLGTFLA